MISPGGAEARLDVRRRRDATSFERLTSPVMVGREREFALLLDAALHPPAVVLVEGEAGVGKTRLVEELLAAPELSARRRYLGGCQELAEPFPLGPVVEALREASLASNTLSPVVGVLRPLLPELAARLPEPPAALGDRRAERHRLFRATRELLSALGPAVLVLEDLHWADEQTVELLRFLVQQLPPELTLVCTYRREELPQSSPLLALAARLPHEIARLQVTLRSLDKGQVRELAGTIFETEEISDEFSDYLFQGSGGLPFAVEELLRLLEDRGDLVRRRGLWVRRDLEELGVPKPVRDAILERLGRLKPDTQVLVQAAAVFGIPVAEQLLLEVAAVSDSRADRALAEALSSALLLEVGEGGYGFRHMLARQAVEEGISPRLRRRLHLRAAQALEGTGPKPVARLAHHYRAAGKMKEWIRYAEAAADRASSLEDDVTAYRLLRETVAVAGLSPATRARLAIKLATCARYCLAHKEAIAILRRLLEEEVLAKGTRGEVRLWLARLLFQEGDTEAVRSETLRALQDLSRRPDHAALAMVFLALPWVTGAPIEERFGWLDQAAKTAARSKDGAVRISVASDRAFLLLYVGDRRGWQVVEEIPQPGPAVEEMRQAARAYGNLASALLHLGYYARAAEFNREHRKLLAQTAHSHGAFAERIATLQLRWLLGQWEGLEEQARLYREVCQDWEAVRVDVQALLGLLLLAHGEVRPSLRLLEPLAEDFRGEDPVLAWVAGGLARIRLAAGRTEAAVEAADRGLDVIQQQGIWAWATDVAPAAVEALLAAGRQPEAAELTRRFARGLRGRDAPAASAALRVCRARLAEADGDRKRAARMYLAAERAWRVLPRPYEAIRARESAGRCLLMEGVEAGQGILTDAMNDFDKLGAAWDVGRVRKTLRDHGSPVPHRRGRKSYGDELSPREAQVSRLASEGLTNREIGVSLFLSPKTVERYLGSALRKLGASSRLELPELLGATGR